MDQRLPPVTIIMGVSGCGKSTYGAALAQRGGARFIEGDDLHGAANIAKMRAGQPLSDDDRWPWLDRIATAVNAALADGPVVATCSALRRAYRDRLRAAITAPVRFVLLDVPLEELRRRVATRNHFMPPALLESQLATLEWPGADEAVEIVQPPSAPNPRPAVQPPSAGSTTPDT
ncbi:gluconokinase [Sphingomonas sp.]|uniref:gluconokinase n=1 Tax=Sphingomonas sp. TaxID=28214 RepID=UPI001DF03FC6|nr:gluconokinase [Sphingomonas sp.]MBX9796249.1 gluconokinase [Sphingomonas sp.]